MPVPSELGSGAVRLVVVDDEKAEIEALKRAFKPYGDHVTLTTTTSGVEAVLLVSEEKPHGLLIDLHMPEVDGLEVVRRIRARKTLEGVRIITMTARRSSDLVEQSLKAGAAACLPKPIDVLAVLDLFRIPIAMAK